MEPIYRPDIITESDDADNEIGLHDPVIALHPSFPYSYAPGILYLLKLVDLKNEMEKKSLIHARYIGLVRRSVLCYQMTPFG